MSKKNKKPLILIIGLVLLAVVLIKVSIAGYKFVPFLFQLMFNRNIELKQTDSQINVLLLGIGGGNHDGTNLTDTIIFANINPKANNVTLVSLPRDLWVPDMKYRINVAYAEGEAKRKGGGLILAEKVVSKILGKDVDYGFRIDFDGFIKAVDLIGGIEIEVERSFDDYAYPIDGKENDSCGYSDNEIKDFTATVSAEVDIQEKFSCRYKHLHFDKGIQLMNGNTALEYVRSRHAEGEEGSDFARSRRQSKVIKAFKDKIFSMQLITNPGKLFSLYDIVRQSIDTDIKDDEFDDFIKLFGKMNNAKTQNAIIDTGDIAKNREGLLINPEVSSQYDYQWVLIPRLGENNFSEIQKYVDCMIKTGNCIVPKIAKE
jgi:polyisoprenyl-teichoic acid--peptidoglycan teichoic acid transferase